MFLLPPVGAVLMAVNQTALKNAVEQTRNNVSSIEHQISSSRSQLQSQRDELAQEQTERSRLTSQMSEHTHKANELAAESRRLTAARGDLAQLSKRINDCLHTVDSALGSSTAIATMSSMRNVVSGIRGVAGALGADEMFAGPLAQLNDAALGILDRRVAAMRRHRLTV